MRLMVCGAGGMLGGAVRSAAAMRGHEVAARTRTELDITDADGVREALARARPQAVINCAAWTDVDGAESDPEGAALVNVRGAAILARACAADGAQLVHVSTDYVFDGEAPRDAGGEPRPYVESDSVGPRSAYGRSKLAGEREVTGASPAHAIVRTAWLFGAGGRNFVDTMLTLAGDHAEVKVVDDQTGCPTFAGHLAPALVQVAEDGMAGLMHVAGGGSCTWFALAREVFSQSGVECDVQPTDSQHFKRPAPRPAWSVLESERAATPRLPHWREGLTAHLAQRAAKAGGGHA
jgi:dTDP-4-dehydrorhamnose reductase